SYLVRDVEPPALRKEGASFEFYFGDDYTFRAGLTDPVPPTASPKWSGIVRAIFRLPTDTSIKPYYTQRYFVRFLPAKPEKVLTLLCDDAMVAALANSIKGRPTEHVVRRDRSGSLKLGLNFACGLVLDATSEEPYPAADLTALRKQFKEIVAPSSYSWPSS